jgi:hypothetical protein
MNASGMYKFQIQLLFTDSSTRFATELSGRKARRRNWEGLADEMKRAGWFDN